MGNTFIGPTTVQTDNITNSDNTGAPTLPFGVITSAPLLFASGTAAAPSITFTGDTDTGLFRKAADSVGFVEGGIEVGSYSATGAWTLGPTVSTNFNGQIHSVIGSIRAGVVTSTDESAFFPIGSNVRTGASAAAQMRTETTTGGTGVTFNNRLSNTAVSAVFWANQAGDLTTTGADVVGSFTQNGAWTFGPNPTVAATYHVVNGTLVGRDSGVVGGSRGYFSSGNGTVIGTNLYRDAVGEKALRTITGISAYIQNVPSAATTATHLWVSNYLDAQTADAPPVFTNQLTIGSITAEGAWSLGSLTTGRSAPHLLRSGVVKQNPSGLRSSLLTPATSGTWKRSQGVTAVDSWSQGVSAADNGWHGMCWSPDLGIFVAVAYSGAGNRVMTSPDGRTWTIQTTPVDNQWLSVCWSSERKIFVAVANTGGTDRVMTSPDGISWTIRTSATNNNWRSVCWSAELGLFVAVANTGTSNRVMTSPDGINWTSRTSPVDNSWEAVAWSAELGVFAAVASFGTGNRAMTSPDGINWTIRTTPVDNNWRALCWAPELGLFVAVANTGTSNRAMTSPDGITWTIRTTPADNSWNAIAWAPELGQLVAVASTGAARVMSSPDGISWTTRGTPGLSWLGLAWSPELCSFAAVADNGTGRRTMMASYQIETFHAHPNSGPVTTTRTLTTPARLGNTNDGVSASYVLLAPAYVSPTTKDPDGFDGEILEYRGSTGASNRANVHRVIAHSAYDLNRASCFSSRSGSSGRMVTCVYLGVTYIAMELTTDSTRTISWRGSIYGSMNAPILVLAADVSSIAELGGSMGFHMHNGLTVGPPASAATNLAVRGAASVTHGIVFPAAANLSANANTLDDYEEGTFTPSMDFSGAFVGGTLGTQTGRYVKIGKTVYFWLYVVVTNLGSSTGNWRVTGLPFTASAATEGYGPVSTACNGISVLGGKITGYVDPATNRLLMAYERTDAAAQLALNINQTHFRAPASGTPNFIISGMYFTDS